MVEARGALWQCRVCDKKFRTREYVDLHMARRHDQLLAEDAPCLADYCHVLGCAEVEEGGSDDRGGASATLDGVGGAGDGFFCEVLLHRCVPPRLSAGHRRAHAAVLARFCSDEDSGVGGRGGAPGGARRGGDGEARSERGWFRSAIWRTLWLVAAVALLIATAGWYVYVWVQRSDTRVRSDLHASRARRAREGWGAWLSRCLGLKVAAARKKLE